MSNTSETLQFKIGEDFGVLIATIAQEHLIYNLNPKKAITTITESLMNCPEDLALEILKGNMVIVVDVDEQNCFVTERTIVHDKLNYPKLNITEWITKEANNILVNGKNLENSLDTVLCQMKIKRVNFSIDYKDIFKFLAGNDKEKFSNFLYEKEEVSELETIVNITKNYIEKSIQILKVMDWMKMTYYNDYDNSNLTIINLCSEMLMNITNKFQNMIKIDYSTEFENKALDNYIESAIEIDEVLSRGTIEPVDIMQNYSAGWLSPDGKYYALNGSIANMLHNQIASALYEAGIVQQSEENETNPDVWLEQQGWVKIHGDNINYAGCLNDKMQKNNVNMTNVQVEIIKKYIQLCHGGIMRLGWKMEKVSAARFEMMADNMEYMNEKYFEF